MNAVVEAPTETTAVPAATVADPKVVDGEFRVISTDSEGKTTSVPLVPEAPAPIKTEEKVTPAKVEEKIDPAPERDEKGRFKQTAAERIDELTRARREAERSAAYWEARAKGTPIVPEAPKPEVRPKRSDFANDEAYEDALASHLTENITKAVKTELKTENHQDQQAVEITANWNKGIEAVRTKHSDFDAVMDAAEIPIQAHVSELLFEHDHGPELAYYFAQNPDTLTRLNKMTPAKVAFQLGEIYAKIGDKSAPTKEPVAEVKEVKPVTTPVSTTNAPAPAMTTSSAKGSTVVPLDQMSMEEYVAHRAAQGASWVR